MTEAYRRAAREGHPEATVVRLAGGVSIGGPDVTVMAGPCAVESEEQLLAVALAVRAAGATVLRGGAYKPRTSPYSFQGLGQPGLGLLARARAETGLCIVTEAVDAEGVETVGAVADVIQIGARNMQNYPLLRAAGRGGKPVLLKRHPGATLDELLFAAEYILAEGNEDVILCERGVRGFDSPSRNLLDVGAIPVLHRLSHLPVMADPSHGTGRSDLVPAMARAAVAAGADGLLIEVHHDPENARSDGAQSLCPPAFADLMRDLRDLAPIVGRRLGGTVGVPA